MIIDPELRFITCVHPGGLHRMAYWEWLPAGEEQAAPKVICAHGLTRNGRDFDALASALVTAGYHVVAPDMIGRGRSDRMLDTNLYAVPQYVSDCITLIARLNTDQVQWVGTSMGGLIAMGIACMPGSPISRLILNDVGPVLSAEGLARIKTYVGLDPRFPSFEEAEQALRASMVSFGPHSASEFRLLSRHFVVAKGAQEWGFHYDPAISKPFHAGYTGEDVLLWPLYDAIDVPTLVLRGAQSDLLPDSVAQAMTERGPKAELQSFEGVGHAPTLISADQIAAVTGFLRPAG